MEMFSNNKVRSMSCCQKDLIYVNSGPSKGGQFAQKEKYETETQLSATPKVVFASTIYWGFFLLYSFLLSISSSPSSLLILFCLLFFNNE